MRYYFKYLMLVFGFGMLAYAIVYSIMDNDRWFIRLLGSIVCFGFYFLLKDNEKGVLNNGS